MMEFNLLLHSFSAWAARAIASLRLCSLRCLSNSTRATCEAVAQEPCPPCPAPPPASSAAPSREDKRTPGVTGRVPSSILGGGFCQYNTHTEQQRTLNQSPAEKTSHHPANTTANTEQQRTLEIKKERKHQLVCRKIHWNRQWKTQH